ncbi:MAG: hypothetical protein WBW67_19080 [Pseudolabrys sp.]
MLPWRTITIQGYLHQSEDAIVVGWETALRISLAITAVEAIGLALCIAILLVCSYSPREKIVEGTAFKDIDTGQTLRHFPYKSDDHSN